MNVFMFATPFGESFTATLVERRYCNGSLAIEMLMPDGEPYGLLTKSLPGAEPLDENCAFFDENNFPGIGKWLESNGLGEPTNRVCECGFCVYPEYRVNKKNLYKEMKR